MDTYFNNKLEELGTKGGILAPINDEEGVTITIKKPTKARVQSAKQKAWMDFSVEYGKLPEMQGKTRWYKMQAAGAAWRELNK